MLNHNKSLFGNDNSHSSERERRCALAREAGAVVIRHPAVLFFGAVVKTRIASEPLYHMTSVCHVDVCRSVLGTQSTLET